MVASGSVRRWARSRTLRVLVLVAFLDLLGPSILLPIARNGADLVFGSSSQGRRQNNHHYSGSFWGLWQNKPTAQNFLNEQCSSVQHTYANLIDPMMSLWNASGFSQDLLEHTSGDRVYISNGRLLLSESTSWARTIPTFVRYIQHIAKMVQLPDLLLPLNPADEPLAQLKSGEAPRPLLAFCKVPGYSDVLLPNTAEGDVYKRPYKHRGDRKVSLTGPSDTRKAAVVWRGTWGGFGDHNKGRHAIVQLGQDRPDLVDSGVSNWNEELLGPPNGRVKPFITMRQQVKQYKYQVWAPGKCASIRLALQLAADAAVFKVEHEDQEWYYPILKPYVHYIPFVASENQTNLLDQLKWAEQHPFEVQNIVSNANAFAHKYLSSQGRDCYFVQLLLRYHNLTTDQVMVPTNAKRPPK